MPCPTRCPLAWQFWAPSGGSLRASKPRAVEQSVEEAAPVPLALPALQRGSLPSGCVWGKRCLHRAVLPAQSSAGSPVGNTVVPSSGTRPCSLRAR